MGAGEGRSQICNLGEIIVHLEQICERIPSEVLPAVRSDHTRRRRAHPDTEHVTFGIQPERLRPTLT